MKTPSSRQKAETWLAFNPVRAYVGKGEKAADVIYDLYDSLEKLLDNHAIETIVAYEEKMGVNIPDMKNGKNELKHCPFCGGKADTIKGTKFQTKQPYYKVYCQECQCRTWEHRIKGDAIKTWNRRE